MSVQPPQDDAQGYCETSDVAEYFDKFDTFTEATDPSRQQVQRRILAESNWVDEFTGHAWRPRRVENAFHDLQGSYSWRQGMPIHLQHRDIRTPLDPDEGDKIELWSGNGYDDLVADDNFTQGRDGDFWVDESRGILYLYRRYAYWNRPNELRLTYRFGKESVPQLIRDTVARRVAAYYFESDQYRKLVPGNEDAPDPTQIAEKWREQAEQDLQPYIEVRSSGL